MVLYLNTIKLIKFPKLGHFGKMILRIIDPKNVKMVKVS